MVSDAALIVLGASAVCVVELGQLEIFNLHTTETRLSSYPLVRGRQGQAGPRPGEIRGLSSGGLRGNSFIELFDSGGHQTRLEWMPFVLVLSY